MPEKTWNPRQKGYIDTYMDSQDAGSRFKQGLYLPFVVPRICKSRLCRKHGLAYMSFASRNSRGAIRGDRRICRVEILKHGGFNVSAWVKVPAAFISPKTCRKHVYINACTFVCARLFRVSVCCLTWYGYGQRI